MSTTARAEHLVDATDLREALGTDRPPVLLDVRWRLTDAPGEGRIRYAEGHLPGARFLDLEAVLTRHSADPSEGRHPLPDAAELTGDLAALGVSEGADVVVYDEAGSYAAERAWWVLRWAGVRARVLDGGIAAWTSTGMPLSTDPATAPAPAPDDGRGTPKALSVGRLPTLDATGAAAAPERGLLIDARAAERYRGEVEPLDPRAGHIPGAINAPAAGLFDGDGRLPDDDELRAALGDAASGDRPVSVYCGSGVSAARDVLALAVLGVDAALFAGSWSAWSNDPDRPVATGA
jgi:thiosulfate/3-mercaptopyruvate sulfurtransferase